MFDHLGTKIFNRDELDENNEIPAPFLLDENEFDVLMKPQLIPKHKIDKKPSRSKRTKQYKRKEIDKNRNDKL